MRLWGRLQENEDKKQTYVLVSVHRTPGGASLRLQNGLGRYRKGYEAGEATAILPSFGPLASTLDSICMSFPYTVLSARFAMALW